MAITAGSGAKTQTNSKPPARTRPNDMRRERLAQTFTNIVGVLMRDPNFKNLRVGDLEWLVVPAIMSGQWRLVQAGTKHAATTPTQTGADAKDKLFVPVAAALWASVSDEIDRRLAQALDKPVQLKPAEWASGDNVWLIAVAGDRRYLPKFLASLKENDFKDKAVKMRVNGPDKTVVVRFLGEPG